jgi:uncharacterized RDD family membrane protein YckC
MKEADMVYAGFWRRFAAMWIDAVLTTPVTFLIIYFLGLLKLPYVIGGLLGLFFFVWYSVYLVHRFERAKKLEELTPNWYGFLKYFDQLWFWSEFLTMHFNKKRRALHDFMAGTVVIRIKKPVASELT